MTRAITHASTGTRLADVGLAPIVGEPGLSGPIAVGASAPLEQDLALRAAHCALLERRLGARAPVETLYRRAHSLLRSLRRHLASLDARAAAA